MPEYLQNNPVPQDAMIGVDYDVSLPFETKVKYLNPFGSIADLLIKKLKKWLGEHPPSTVRPALDVTIAHLRSEGVTDIAGSYNMRKGTAIS